MSALGHKRTLADVRVMSALPPKADIGTGPRYYLRRTSSGSLPIFAAIHRASSLVSIFAVSAGGCGALGASVCQINRLAVRPSQLQAY